MPGHPGMIIRKSTCSIRPYKAMPLSICAPISPKVINKRIVLLGYYGQARGPRGALRKPQLQELS